MSDVPADMVTLFEIDREDPAPTYIQLERRVRVAIADGALKPGEALPSVRNLARALGLFAQHGRSRV